MRFSENWLRTFVNPSLSSEALGHALTMAGLELEELEPAAPPFEKVVVAEVLSLVKHPDADRLNVCQVNAGGETLQIVCGASNVAAGLKVPCALVGAALPGGLAIKQAKLRGVESFGMLCSAKELGLAEEAQGLMVLPADAPVGQSIRQYLDLDDQLFTLKLTPNRSDCLSVLGIAREVSAITGTPLNVPQVGEIQAVCDKTLPVALEAPAACPRYAGRVIAGVNAKARTPDWMAQRLERSGLRAISPLVDVTNYVLLEMGQPLHAFDLAKIQGGITVRFAKEGERLALLNEQTVKLEADMLVIADQAGPLALAGIMGGAASAVGDATTDIFLESAFFAPGVIAGRSRRLGFGSDSSYRFERGVDFAATLKALDRATQLIVEICGGQPGPVAEAMAELPQREPVRLRVERVKRVLGIALDGKTIGDMLGRLGLAYGEQDGVFEITPPSYRFDLAIEEDFIEEVARLYGYDNVPAHPPKAATTMLPATESARSLSAVKRLLVDREYQEIVSYAFVDESWERDFAANADPVRLLNPIAAHMSVMRSTLVGGLVDILRANLNRKQARVRIFESGRCFAKAGGGFAQPNRIGGLCYGAAMPEQWGETARPVDFYDAKADVEALLWPAVARFEAAEHPAFHPGQSARVSLDGKAIGWVGVLHPRWRQAYDLPAAPAMFELDVEPLLQREKPVYQEVSKFPPVRRDLALVVREETAVQSLLDALQESLPETVVNLTLFDVYRGKGVDSDKKSLAFSVLLQDTRKTLTDEEVDAAMAHLVQVLTTRFDAKLRT